MAESSKHYSKIPLPGGGANPLSPLLENPERMS